MSIPPPYPGGSGNATSIQGTQVGPTAPTINGQVLAYDLATGKWSPVNTALGGAPAVPAYLFNSLPVSTPGASTIGGITTEAGTGTVTIYVALGAGLQLDGSQRLAIKSLIGVNFAGRNGAGNITVSGIAAGDVLIAPAVLYSASGGVPTGDPLFTITGTNTVHQGAATDLSGFRFAAMVYSP